MIIDVTGIVLTPGNMGEFCAGNGKHFNDDGKLIECCCDECDYLMCCTDMHNNKECLECRAINCPNCANTTDYFQKKHATGYCQLRVFKWWR